MNKFRYFPYYKVHFWLYKNYGKANHCDFCHTTLAKKYEWALKKGCTYKCKRENFIQLCTSCHVKYDTTEETIQKFRERIGEKNGHYGKHHSDKWKEWQSIDRKRWYQTEEGKAKRLRMSERNKLKK